MIRFRIRHIWNEAPKIFILEGLQGIVDRFAVNVPVFLMSSDKGPLHAHGHNHSFPVGGVEFGNRFVPAPQVRHDLHARHGIGRQAAGELHQQPVPDYSLPEFEEIRIRRGPRTEKHRSEAYAIGALEGCNDCRREHLHDHVLGPLPLQPEQFRRQIHRFRWKFFNGDNVDIYFLGVFSARFVDGAPIGVIEGKQKVSKPTFGASFPL